MDINLSSQKRETILFYYSPVLIEALLFTVFFCPPAGSLLMSIGVNLQPVQSHCLATC